MRFTGATTTTHEQEMMATDVLGNIVLATPRQRTGTNDDAKLVYQVEPKRALSLAQSAREAAEANQRARDEARRRRLGLDEHGNRIPGALAALAAEEYAAKQAAEAKARALEKNAGPVGSEAHV